MLPCGSCRTKNRFSEVVQKATSEGPQEVSVLGKRAVVIVADEDYDKLFGPKQSFMEFLLSGPPWDVDAEDRHVSVVTLGEIAKGSS